MFAAERVLDVSAPASASPSSPIEVVVRASTDAGAGEQIGFLHVEYSDDDGATWTGLSYEQEAGVATARHFKITTGEAGSKTLVRAKAAFRGGVAGDVDYRGAAIQWKSTWGEWREPPARWAETTVTDRG